MTYADFIALIILLLYIAMDCTGIVLNSVLLVVFSKHPETRIPENVPLINLCVVDIVNLLSPVATLLITFTSSTDNIHIRWVILFFYRSFVLALSTYSVASVSVQRYLSLFRKEYELSEDKRKYFHALFIVLGVWILAAISATAEVLIIGGANICTYNNFVGETSFRLVMYGAVPFIIIVVFYIISNCKMRTSISQSISEEANVTFMTLQDRRRKSARIIIALAICFAVTQLACFTVFWILRRVMSTDEWWSYSMRRSVAFVWIFIPLFNPIVICAASSKLRQLYIKYCCCCCRQTDVSTRLEFNHIQINTTPGEVELTGL